MSRVKRGWVELDITNADSINAGDIKYSADYTIEEAINLRMGQVGSGTFTPDHIISVASITPTPTITHDSSRADSVDVVLAKDSGKVFCSDGDDIPALETASSSIIPTQKEVSRRFKQSVGIKIQSTAPYYEPVDTGSLIFAYSHDTTPGDSFRVTQLVNGRTSGLKVRSTGTLGSTNNYIPTEDLIKTYIDTNITTSTSHLAKNTSYSSANTNYLVVYSDGTQDTIKAAPLAINAFVGSYITPSDIDDTVNDVPTLMFCRKTVVDGLTYLTGLPYTQDTNYVVFKGEGILSNSTYVIPSEKLIMDYVDSQVGGISFPSRVSRSTEAEPITPTIIPVWSSADNTETELAYNYLNLSISNDLWPDGVTPGQIDTQYWIPSCAACDARYVKLGTTGTGTITRSTDVGINNAKIPLWKGTSHTSSELSYDEVDFSSVTWVSASTTVASTSLIDANFTRFNTDPKSKNIAIWNSTSPGTNKTLSTDSYNIIDSIDGWTDSNNLIPTTQLITNNFMPSIITTTDYNLVKEESSTNIGLGTTADVAYFSKDFTSFTWSKPTGYYLLGVDFYLYYNYGEGYGFVHTTFELTINSTVLLGYLHKVDQGPDQAGGTTPGDLKLFRDIRFNHTCGRRVHLVNGTTYHLSIMGCFYRSTNDANHDWAAEYKLYCL